MPEIAPDAHMTPPLGPDLADPAKFRTIRRVPVLDAHEPIKKKVFDPSAISEANPKGLVDRVLTVDEADLEVLAANSNRRASEGNPPSLQLGHTPLEDRPEQFQPKHVGFAANYCVEKINGAPHLVADLHYLAGQYDEAETYPRISVERVGYDDPARHHIGAVALIRREPERHLPAVGYGSASPLARVCYSRAVASPTLGEPERQDLVDFGAKHGITDLAKARERYQAERIRLRANYAAAQAPTGGYPSDPTIRAAIRAYAEKHGIDSIAEASRRYLKERGK